MLVPAPEALPTWAAVHGAVAEQWPLVVLCWVPHRHGSGWRLSLGAFSAPCNAQGQLGGIPGVGTQAPSTMATHSTRLCSRDLFPLLPPSSFSCLLLYRQLLQQQHSSKTWLLFSTSYNSISWHFHCPVPVRDPGCTLCSQDKSRLEK